MATAYTNPYEYSGGIPLDQGSIDVAGQVMSMKQNKYDANYNAIQQTIDQYTQASGGLMRDIDRKYASERLSRLINNVNNAGNRDWSTGTIASEMSHYVGQVLDNNVMNAISSTKKYQNFKTNLDELKAKKPELYSQQNEAYATQDLQRYMSSDQAGDVLSIGEYSPYTDYKKTILDNAEKFQKMGYSVQWDPVKNAPGFTMLNKTEFLDEGKARQLISMALGEKDAQQMRIDSWYNGRGMSDEQVNMAFNSYNAEKINQVDDQINYLNTLTAGKKQEQVSEINKQIDSLKELKKNMNNPVDGRDNKLFQMHYNNFVDNTAGTISYKRITDFKIDDSQFQFDKFQFEQQKHADSMAMEQQKFILDTRKAEAEMRSKGIDPATGKFDAKLAAEYSGASPAGYEQPIPAEEQNIPTLVAAIKSVTQRDLTMDKVIDQALMDPEHDFWDATGLNPEQFTGPNTGKISAIKGHLNKNGFEFAGDASPAMIETIEGYKDAMKDRKELGMMSKNVEDGAAKSLTALLKTGDFANFDTLKTWVNDDGKVVTTSDAISRRVFGNKVLSSFKQGMKPEDFLKTNMGKSALINILAAKKADQNLNNDEKAAIDYTINQITKTFTKPDGKTRVDNSVIAQAQQNMKEVGAAWFFNSPGRNDDYADLTESELRLTPLGPILTRTPASIESDQLTTAVYASNATSNVLAEKYKLKTRMVYQKPIITGEKGNEAAMQGAFLQIMNTEDNLGRATGDTIPSNAELDTKNGKNIEVYSEGLDSNGSQLVSFRIPIISTKDNKSVADFIKTGKINKELAPQILVAGIENKPGKDYNNPASLAWSDKRYVGGLPTAEKANEISIKNNHMVKFNSAEETTAQYKAMFNLQGLTNPVYHQQLEKAANDNYKIIINKNTHVNDPSAAYLEVRDGSGKLVIDSTPINPNSKTIEGLANDPLERYNLIQRAVEIQIKKIMVNALSNARQ